MRSALVLLLVGVIACAKKDSGSSASTGSAAPVEKPVSPPPSPPPAPPPTESDPADEVAKLVVHDVGSKALGNQTIDASCVAVVVMPAGDWTVAAAKLNDCGDKTARSILWLYKRKGEAGKWNEDYVGQPPRCWKGVPADLVVPVTKATKIPAC